MLVLDRRVGESLMIGSTVTVTVLSVRGRQVRIGIQAPKALGVHREEVFVRIQGDPDLRAFAARTRSRPSPPSLGPRVGAAALWCPEHRR